jgi:hypothetical protein
MPEQFRRIVFVWNWKSSWRSYWNQSWFNPSIIEAEKPEVFIEFLLETRLYEEKKVFNDMRSLIHKPAAFARRGKPRTAPLASPR